MKKCCQMCGIDKEVSEFYKKGFYANKEQRYHPYCKACLKKYNQKRRKLLGLNKASTKKQGSLKKLSVEEMKEMIKPLDNLRSGLIAAMNNIR